MARTRSQLWRGKKRSCQGGRVCFGQDTLRSRCSVRLAVIAREDMMKMTKVDAPCTVANAEDWPQQNFHNTARPVRNYKSVWKAVPAEQTRILTTSNVHPQDIDSYIKTRESTAHMDGVYVHRGFNTEGLDRNIVFQTYTRARLHSPYFFLQLVMLFKSICQSWKRHEETNELIPLTNPWMEPSR